MTVLWVILVLVVVAYFVAVGARADGQTAAQVLRRDSERVARHLFGASPLGADAALFDVGRRRTVGGRPPQGEGTAAAPPEVNVRGTRAGGNRRRNPSAPCWLCGKPNTPGHHH